MRHMMAGVLAAILTTGAAHAGPIQLNGQQIEALVNGATLSARRMSMTVQMQFLPDGMLAVRMGPMEAVGTWSVEGDALCTALPQRPPNMARCETLEQTSHNRLQSSNGLALTIETIGTAMRGTNGHISDGGEPAL